MTTQPDELADAMALVLNATAAQENPRWDMAARMLAALVLGYPRLDGPEGEVARRMRLPRDAFIAETLLREARASVALDGETHPVESDVTMSDLRRGYDG